MLVRGLCRRTVLRAGLVAAAITLCAAHTPYRQWMVYRRKHLLVLTDKTDPPSYPLGKAVAAILTTYLPRSQSRVTRARDLDRVASLITTGQLELAVMRSADAVALAAGTPPLDGYLPVTVRVLSVLGDYLLICRDDFPDHHAYLVAKTIEENRARLCSLFRAVCDGAPIPDSLRFHAGVLAYRRGLPLPAPPDDSGDNPAPSDAAK